MSQQEFAEFAHLVWRITMDSAEIAQITALPARLDIALNVIVDLRSTYMENAHKAVLLLMKIVLIVMIQNVYGVITDIILIFCQDALSNANQDLFAKNVTQLPKPALDALQLIQLQASSSDMVSSLFRIVFHVLSRYAE